MLSVVWSKLRSLQVYICIACFLRGSHDGVLDPRDSGEVSMSSVSQVVKVTTFKLSFCTAQVVTSMKHVCNRESCFLLQPTEVRDWSARSMHHKSCDLI